MGIVERKEREKEARRLAILDAAKVIFKDKGFTLATMDDIARQAELAKGTVYLYYKSKEELLLGLVMRGLEIMAETFATGMQSINGSFEKLMSMGDSYWQFANDYPFYFAIMHMMDMPDRTRPEQIGEDVLQQLHAKSNCVWRDMIELVEQSKAEGMVKQEVEAFAFSMLLWMNLTSTLRFAYKVQSTPDNFWKADSKYNPCSMDLRSMYDLNANLLFQQVVTESGRMKLAPIVWPTCTSPEVPAYNYQPLDEAIPEEFLSNSSL